MSFDWSEYFNVAQELAEQAKSSSFQEAKVRAAISRAYYAAFGMARHHLRSKDKIVEPYPLVNSKGEFVNIHEYVREIFKNSSDERRVEIGVNLERLCQYRNIADYRLYNDIFNKPLFTVQATLNWTKEVLSALKRL